MRGTEGYLNNERKQCDNSNYYNTPSNLADDIHTL